MKGIILYKNHKYKKRSEKRIISELKTNRSIIECILIPMVGMDIPTYIPIKPNKRWIFDTAKMSIYTSGFQIDFDMNAVMIPKNTSEQSMNIRTTASLFDLVNWMHIVYKVYGYREYTSAYLYPMYEEIMSSIVIHYMEVSFDNESTPYILHSFNDIEEEILAGVYSGEDIKDTDVIYDEYKSLFVSVGKDDLADKIVMHGKRWTRKANIKSSHYDDIFYPMVTFNAYTCVNPEVFVTLRALPRLYTSMGNYIFVSKSTNSASNFGVPCPMLETDYLEFIYALQSGDTPDDFYEIYYASDKLTPNQLFELILFRTTLLTYLRYSLYCGIMECQYEADDIHSLLWFGRYASDKSCLDFSDIIDIFDFTTISTLSIINRLNDWRYD